MKIAAPTLIGIVLSVVRHTLAFSTPSSSISSLSVSRPTKSTEASAPNTRRFARQTEEKSGFFSDEVQQEAREVLEKVGWARPMEGEGEMTSDDPFVQQINEGIRRDFGVDLDDLLNPAKVGTNGTWGFTIVSSVFSSNNAHAAAGCQLGTRSLQSESSVGGVDRLDRFRSRRVDDAGMRWGRRW